MDKKKWFHRPKKKHAMPGERERRKKLLHLLAGIVAVAAVLFLSVTAWRHYQTSRAEQFQNRLDAVQNGASGSFEQISPDTPLYVLVIGRDGNTPQQVNFVGLAAVNKEKKHIDFIMLPDNTKIEGRKEKGIQELQDVYTEGGRTLVQAVVEDMFHIPVPFYVEFSEDTFVKMIDMSGGLPMYVEENMYHADETGATDINLFQGYQTLTGQEAAGYMRYIDEDGYLSRTQRQERLVKLFYADRQQRFGISNMLFLYRFWNNVDSNISAKDIAALAFSFRHVPAEDIHFYILPGENTNDGATGGKTQWSYDPVEGQKIIGATNNAIAPAPEPPSNTP